jgi:tetratricopeptide (TPR) repeat protein
MKKILLLLFIFCLQNQLLPQSDISFLIKQGLDYSYNFHLEKAEDIFDKIISKNPNDPKGYHYKSSLYLWIYLSNKDNDDYNNFLKYSDLALEKALKVLDQKDDDENTLYILGSNYGFRAMAFMKANSYIKAVWAVKNSNKYLQETLEKYPKKYDAYLGLGIFNYALSLVPGMYKWVLKMAGLSGNRDEGINYLKFAYRNGTYSKTEAAYYLSQIYSETLIDYNMAIGYLKQLLIEYPDNILFQYSYAVVLIKNRKPLEAEKILKQIIKTDNPHFQQITSFSNFLIGDILFHKNEFNPAIVYYEKFISSTKEIDYTGIAYYRTALCYELTNRREESRKLYIFAENGNLDIQDDAYAKRKSEIYINRTISFNEIGVIKAANMLESGLFQSVVDSLQKLIPKIISEKLKSEVELYLCDAYYEMGKFQESIDYGMEASKNNNEESWIKPYAYYYIARAYYRTGNINQAKIFLEKAEDINDYDYQTKLIAFINGLKIKLSM